MENVASIRGYAWSLLGESVITNGSDLPKQLRMSTTYGIHEQREARTEGWCS
jgi:hypothetical protein